MFELDLQKAVFGALDGVISVEVCDDVSQGTEYPYVVIGGDSFTDWSDDTNNGMEGTINIHTWHRPEGSSGKRGTLITKEIQSEVYGVLQRSNFAVGDYGNIGMTFEYSDVFMDVDGLTYHGVQRFRVNLAVKHEFILG